MLMWITVARPDQPSYEDEVHRNPGQTANKILPQKGSKATVTSRKRLKAIGCFFDFWRIPAGECKRVPQKMSHHQDTKNQESQW